MLVGHYVVVAGTNEIEYLWRGGRDSKAQPPAVTPRKRKGQDP
jgi:hypothetical protein